MNRTRKLHYVVNGYGEIVGRFTDRYSAIAYIRYYHSICPKEWVFLRTITIKG